MCKGWVHKSTTVWNSSWTGGAYRVIMASLWGTTYFQVACTRCQKLRSLCHAHSVSLERILGWSHLAPEIRHSASFDAVFVGLLIKRIKRKTFFLVDNRFVKVFTLILWQTAIVFRKHNLKAIFVTFVLGVFHVSFWWVWINRLSSIEVILNFFVIKGIVTESIAWCFEEIFQMILILRCTLSFIKELPVVWMQDSIAFAVSDMCSIVKRRYISRSWKVNAITFEQNKSLSTSCCCHKLLTLLEIYSFYFIIKN